MSAQRLLDKDRAEPWLDPRWQRGMPQAEPSNTWHKIPVGPSHTGPHDATPKVTSCSGRETSANASAPPNAPSTRPACPEDCNDN